MLVGRVVAGLRGAERRNLDDIVADVDMDQAKAAADDERPAEQRLDLLGRRIGRDVEILGLDPEQQVTNGAADDERLEALVLQPSGDRARRGGQLVASHRMLVGRVDAGSVRPPAGQQAGEQAANHLEPVHAMATNALERETPLRGGGLFSQQAQRGRSSWGRSSGRDDWRGRQVGADSSIGVPKPMVCASKRRPAPSRIIEGLRRAARASPGTASATCQETPCTNT